MTPASSRFVDSDNIWRQIIRESPVGPPRPALFLDRDGTVVQEIGYLHKVGDLQLIPGAASLIAAANRSGLPVVLVTNQAGIGRGYYGWGDFQAVQDELNRRLAREDARIDAVFACPHHRDGVGCYSHADHPMRKPNPGMIVEAANRLNLDLRRSWIIGDKSIDLAAGRNAGLRAGFLVLSGHGRDHLRDAEQLRSPDFEVLSGASILDAFTVLDRMGVTGIGRPR